MIDKLPARRNSAEERMGGGKLEGGRGGTDLGTDGWVSVRRPRWRMLILE